MKALILFVLLCIGCAVEQEDVVVDSKHINSDYNSTVVNIVED